MNKSVRILIYEGRAFILFRECLRLKTQTTGRHPAVE